MPDKPFKVFERQCAELLDGTRYPANTGGPVDVESGEWIAQCKLVHELSLERLTQLVEQIDAEADQRGKRGCVLVKCRRGRGKESPTLLVLSVATWGAVPCDSCGGPTKRGRLCGRCAERAYSGRKT